MLISPHSPVTTGLSLGISARRKDRIRKINKIRESTVEDKAHHVALEPVRPQIIIIEAAGSSGAHRSALEHVHIQN